MKTGLLRLAKRSKNGVRSWTVPGFTNAAKLIPAAVAFHGSTTIRVPVMIDGHEEQWLVFHPRNYPRMRAHIRDLIAETA